MQDRILDAYLTDFIDEFGLAGIPESTAFEHFVNHCVISRHYPEAFDPDDMFVAGGGDLGLDGIGILVNDHLAYSREDADHFKNALRRLDAQFVFVQTKTSAKFEASEIGTFISGVRHFFNAELPITANSAVRELHQVKEHIFKSVIDMEHAPACRLYYVTTGVWADPTEPRARIDQGVTDLRNTGLFSDVSCSPIDAESLKRMYRELHHRIVREMVFEKHTILPKIGGVQEAYIGIVPCLEYLKLICDESGTLNRGLFYDNVRDFQGHNEVNGEIEATVQDAGQSDRFALLNNGVTIVARDANKVGATFRLRDYQIVNGCQTSHILYLNRERLTDSIYLPIKLIVTADGEVTNQIIQGTNRQTEVKREAFESLAPFQKQLEELYSAMGARRTQAIYYERRSKQYEHLAVRREAIITLATQTKCFVAMFLNEPHSTHRYYGELLTSYRSRLFSDNHSPMAYFVSGAALAVQERLIAQGRLPRRWRAFRFQLLMVFRLQNEVSDPPHLNSKEMDRYCEALLAVLDNDATAEAAFQRAGKTIEGLWSEPAPGRELPERTKAFTESLVGSAAKGKVSRTVTVARSRGTVKWFSDIRGYGFIGGDDGVDVFVHYSGVKGTGYRSLAEGDRVEFSIVSTSRGSQARDVESIEK